MTRLLGIVFVAAIAGVLIFAATRPDSFMVERALRMEATPEQVFPIVADFENWQLWSPWLAKDPAIEVTLGPRTSGMGARYEWSGNRAVGTGRTEIVAVSAPTMLRMNVTMFEPYTASNEAQFVLEQIGDYTKLTWRVAGPMPYLSRLMSVFTSMDALLGPDLKAGLENIKTVVESRPAEPPAS